MRVSLISWALIVAAPLAIGAQAVQQKTFATSAEALEALIAAARSGDSKELLNILGEAAEPTLHSGDAVQDRQVRARFIEAFNTAHELKRGANGQLILEIGKDQWEFPFPVVQRNSRWHFDTATGIDEVINRRIGENELSTLQSCAAFVDAQREYYRLNPQRDPLMHFAQKLVSTEGRKDGLYWPAADSETPSPLGEGFARARAEGYFLNPPQKTTPYHGYVYKLLSKQGSHAKGGAYDYMAGDKLLGGFALLAFPAEYNSSGVVSFIVSHEGVIYSKDLGPNTFKLASHIEAFDPDSSWKRELAVD